MRMAYLFIMQLTTDNLTPTVQSYTIMTSAAWCSDRALVRKDLQSSKIWSVNAYILWHLFKSRLSGAFIFLSSSSSHPPSQTCKIKGTEGQILFIKLTISQLVQPFHCFLNTRSIKWFREIIVVQLSLSMVLSLPNPGPPGLPCSPMLATGGTHDHRSAQSSSEGHALKLLLAKIWQRWMD